MKKNITINNCKTHYSDNDINGPAIVFVHGNSQSSKVFENQFNDPILNDNFRLISIDLPGHGTSGKATSPEETYNFGGYGQFIKDFCDELNIEDALFAGSSLGGNVLIENINNLSSKGLLVLGTAPIESIADFGDATLVNPEDLAYLFNETYRDSDIEFVLRSQFSKNFDKSKTPAFLREDIIKNDGMSRVLLGKSLAEGRNKNEKTIIKELKIPLAMVLGKDELLINVEYLRKIDAPTLWQNMVIEIAGAGHSAQIEKAQDFNKVLFNFASEVFKQ